MAVAMDMSSVALGAQNGYAPFQEPDQMAYQAAESAEPPAQRLQRLQQEASQLADEQSQVELFCNPTPDMRVVETCWEKRFVQALCALISVRPVSGSFSHPLSVRALCSLVEATTTARNTAVCGLRVQSSCTTAPNTAVCGLCIQSSCIS